MTEQHVKLEDMHVERPDVEQLKKTYASLQEKFASTKTTQERVALVEEWDKVRDNYDTWEALVHFRFTQDTTNEEAVKEREYADEISPVVQGLNVNLKRQFLANGQDIEHEYGTHLLELWKSDITGFRDEIQEDAVKEGKRSADYTALLSSAKIDFRGDTYNISELGKFLSDADRETRHDASKAMWKFFEENGEAFDSIYDDLVHIRTEKAKKLGFDNFVPLGYLQMQRVDYGEKDVENFREQIREELVPLCNELREEQRKGLGVDKLMAWDGSIFDTKGDPKPSSDPQVVTNQSLKVFEETDPDIGKFFKILQDCNLLDLASRKNKAGGGYCTSFPTYHLPAIFSNFNGTRHDVEVVTHETGHAFQYYKSAYKHPAEYRWPTMESCEIHSMSLEFLTWPSMELFFGDDADRFRRTHLIGSLLFLPYGCAVDHFQHLVYQHPNATPAERHEFWREMEQTYLPHLDWGDISYPSKGGRWQLQSHIFTAPFYYIDYTLAQTCAFQYLRWSLKDRKAAMKSYIQLCKRGGEDSFQNLVKSAGLTSPFEPGCLKEVVDFCREWLKQ